MVSLSTSFALVFLVICIWKKCDGATDGFIAHYGLDSETMQTILDEHNAKRRMPSASNMKILEWDKDIVNEIKEFLETCDFNHEGDLNGYGENIHFGNDRFTELYPKAIQAWYDEESFFDIGTAICEAGKVCGHYTQVVWATSERVGCATAECSSVTGQESSGTGKLTVCRYFPGGNIFAGGVLRPPYKVGEACTECEGEWTACIEGLCARPNDTQMTTEEYTTMAQTTPHAVDITTAGASFTSEPITTVRSIPTVDSLSTAPFLKTTGTVHQKPTTTPDSSSTTPVVETPTSVHQNATSPVATSNTTPATETTTSAVHQNATTPISSSNTTSTTETTTSVPTDAPTISTCSAEYLELLSEYRKSLDKWKKVYQEFVDKQRGC